MDDTPSESNKPHPHVEASLGRTILSLAIPALGTLLTEPLLILADTSMVGHLGTAQLAGLSAGSTVLTFIVGLCIFLAYTTTAVTARHIGAGRVVDGLRYGVQGMWLAAAIGVILSIALFFGAPWAAHVVGTSGAVAEQAVAYIHASCGGIAGMLIVLAANGVMRGLLDMRTPLVVSTIGAIANVPLSFSLIYLGGFGVSGAGAGTMIAQLGMGAAFVIVVGRTCRRRGVSLRPSLTLMTSAGLSGAPLMVRTLCLQLSILMTLSAAAKLGAVTLASHQIVKSLWTLSAFGMDALAIAAQALVGQALGAGDKQKVRHLIRHLSRWGMGTGVVFGAVIALASPIIPLAFTANDAVVDATRAGLIAVAGCQIIAGIVYMYDGILIGANDTRYLAVAQLVTFLVFAPVIWMAGEWGTPGGHGVVVIWLAYGIVFFGMRWLTLGLRIRTDEWMNV
ncbi:MATE family efflux transporter [Nanchangia anserum]|uniref:MATE family efflux transporter n=1 Tax=Nanchangia anserum TaxID=2692125 RepID=A0A8I0G843_9ACTO|nr:MATE family efflux transporter [Nanchangia anserum]MBD3689640.1 MATE family efflux transporter [Nanchangia anserum]QOX81822.1 MATE family efflux transporter [Nanchangia anserum]